jgi:hypothetical protein
MDDPYRLMAAPAGALSQASPFGTVRPASSCAARWDRMHCVPQLSASAELFDKVRTCGECGKKVYCPKAITTSEADRLVRLLEPSPLALPFRRADGTIILDDCPIGARSRLRSQVVTIAIATSAILVALLVFGGGGAFAGCVGGGVSAASSTRGR